MINRSLAIRSSQPRPRLVSRSVRRPSFTLVELMVVISIIGVLASAVLMAMAGVMEQAKVVRTKAQVAKLHELIMTKWQSYNTRTLRVTLPALTQPATGPPRRWPVIPETFVDSNGNGKWDTGEPHPADENQNGVYDSGVARVRLDMLRDLMRMELPDRISDLTDNPALLWPAAMPKPSLFLSYRRRADAAIKARHGATASWTDSTKWTTSYQGAECLYLIIASIREGDSRGIDYFKESEIGDIDDDGMFEILDAWGRPIEFLRWPAGYASEVQPLDASVAADSFDPFHVDTRQTYRLVPLIYSAGPDGIYDIVTDSPTAIRYSMTDPLNDPYHSWAGPSYVGMRFDVDGNGTIDELDNITNHLLDES